MTLNPLDLRKEDIDKLVAYQRRMRALSEAGVKPEKQDVSSIQGSALLDKLKLVKQGPPVERRKI